MKSIGHVRMDKVQVTYHNPYAVAHATHQYISNLPSPIRYLHLRPVDYQKPGKTSWWLVPNQRQSVFPYSKFYFHQIPFHSGDLFAGFSFERGVGGQLQGLVDKTLLLQSHWYWRRFLNDVVAGVYYKPLTSLHLWTLVNPKLCIELFDFNQLHLRHLETGVPDDVLLYAIDTDSSSLQTLHHGTGQLAQLNNQSRIYDLILQIEMSPEFAWYFMRFTFGTEIAFSHVQNTQDIAQLWDNVLAPWLPLIM